MSKSREKIVYLPLRTGMGIMSYFTSIYNKKSGKKPKKNKLPSRIPAKRQEKIWQSDPRFLPPKTGKKIDS